MLEISKSDVGNGSRSFDVMIIGGGIGGTTLAAILARHGVRVGLIEAGGHPRFAIGESTIPETIVGLRVLARRYDVPEIGYLAGHHTLRRKVSASSGVKRNFGFAYHREGEPFRAEECTQHPTWSPPIGPDSHFFRQDIDAYLFQVAVSYGATGLQYTPVTGVDFDSDGATVRTASSGEYRAKYVVDAGGMRSLLGEQFDLRIQPAPYQTRSRTIFNHFVGVEPFDDVIPSRKEHLMPSPFSQGTLHHLFKGGWAWVIPFDNHIGTTSQLCSVGINLDLDQYPRRDGESPEDEFWAHVNRFPTFRAQMRKARAVRPYTSSNQSQFASKQIVGDRWCLLPHASDFIDPLFSSGLAVTMMILNALGHRLIDAVREDDFATERFEYVQTWTKKSFAYYDNLVSYSYTSWDNFDLWNAWHRVWCVATMYGANSQMQTVFDYEKTKDKRAFDRLEQAPYRGLQAVDNPQFATLFETACAAMQSYRDKDIDAAEAGHRIHVALRDSGLVPSPRWTGWRALDPDNRLPTGAFTLLGMTRVLLWGKFASPAHVRGTYFTNGFTGVSKEAAKLYLSEVARGAGLGTQVARDMLTYRNRDWRKVGGLDRRAR
ncbi:tryptophan 7-halogenase [Nocardia sp. CDC153]|uniref:NAD(P)/FAD-dependent oxidoreductase n=1 Tax=Nocardia sp. CDC153 TaxID=3112167 RepID=UPI002DBE20E1|nr:tryptophan 7-halogenase [Nocardia sp. CDC153]MEC3956866.1 tryptophan 7-halogenase [Nocardia sp. CDC153]